MCFKSKPLTVELCPTETILVGSSENHYQSICYHPISSQSDTRIRSKNYLETSLFNIIVVNFFKTATYLTKKT